MRFTRGAVINCKKLLQTNSKEFTQLLFYVDGIVGINRFLGYSKEFTQLLIYVNGIVGIIGLWVASVVMAFGPWRCEV
jgi:hypothetical protein